MIRIALVAILLAQLAAVDTQARIFEDPLAPEVVPRYDPEGEALRSLILPGWSQMRQGADTRGTAHMVIAFVCAVFVSGAIEVPVFGNEEDNFGQVLAGALYGLNAVVSAFDAYGRAAESNRENGWDLEEEAARTGPGLRMTLARWSF